MVARFRRGRLELFPSTEVNNMLEKTTQVILMIVYYIVLNVLIWKVNDFFKY